MLIPQAVPNIPQPAAATTTRTAPGQRLVGGNETAAVATFGPQVAGSYERAARLTEEFGSDEDRRRAAQRAAVFSGEAGRQASTKAPGPVSSVGPILEAIERGANTPGARSSTPISVPGNAASAFVVGVYETTSLIVGGGLVVKGAVLDILL